ncbi:MAG: hypothetical protein ACOC58_02885 [Chloroflexota bacterium]
MRWAKNTGHDSKDMRKRALVLEDELVVAGLCESFTPSELRQAVRRVMQESADEG